MAQVYSFDEVKKAFADKAAIAVFALTIPTASLSFYRAFSIGWQPQMYLHVALCIIYTLIFWKRKRIPTSVIATALITSFFSISFASYLFMGLTGAGQLFLVVGLTLAAIFLEKRSLIVYSALSVIALIATAFIHVYGIIPMHFDVRAYQYEWASWTVAIAALCMACFVSVMVTQNMVRTLKDNMVNLSEKNDQLALALSDLQRTNGDKGQLLSKISHELRTPINGLMGMAQALANSDLNATQRRQVESLLGAGAELTKTVNDSTYHTQLSDGKREITPIQFDMGNLLDDLHRAHSQAAESKGLMLAFSNSVEQTRFVGDARRLYDVLSSLLSNAIKFSDHGTVRLSLSNADGALPLRFLVEDTGIGIASQWHERIFEPFFQVESGLSRSHDGMGLGLSVANALVESMGGRLAVESALGKGSSFSFCLALPVVEDADRPSTPESEQSLEELNVLIVEDNKLNAVIAENYLHQLGHSVRWAENGAEAVSIAEEGWPSFIFMDIHMPLMDGMEATEKIRQLPDMDALPIVALTADAFEERHELFLQSGMDEVLTKPCSKDQLASCISRHLKWINARV